MAVLKHFICDQGKLPTRAVRQQTLGLYSSGGGERGVLTDPVLAVPWETGPEKGRPMARVTGCV